jgi:hypothetical protein
LFLQLMLNFSCSYSEKRFQNSSSKKEQEETPQHVRLSDSQKPGFLTRTHVHKGGGKRGMQGLAISDYGTEK